MLRMHKILIASLILALASISSSHAQMGDAAAGEAKSATCMACHGPDGNSPLPEFPSIAGQVPGYIAQQLAAFKSGARNNPVMLGMVATLNEQDMADLDAYYSGQTATVQSITEDQMEDALAGKEIYRGGYEKYSIPSCMGCHGPNGAGIPPNFPRLSGQHAKYTETQLLLFKSGERQSPIMHPIAFPLSEEQIRQLSLYISALN